MQEFSGVHFKRKRPELVKNVNCGYLMYLNDWFYHCEIFPKFVY